MEHGAKLSESLERKLNEICNDIGFVRAMMMFLETDEERQTLLDIAEAGGEEATPKNLMYAAINMDDARNENK